MKNFYKYLSTKSDSLTPEKWIAVSAVVLLGLFFYAILMAAWFNDDSMISLVQILNLQHGDGLVFNYGERVQAFTSPTWFFLLASVTYLTKNYFYTIIFLSMFLSIAALLIVFYFGHLFPNTFYAKLKAGYPLLEYLKRGVHYYYIQLKYDLITLLIIGTGIIVGFLRQGVRKALSFGLFLYLVYVLYIGGDFMQGRFLAVPAFIATFLIVDYLIALHFKKSHKFYVSGLLILFLSISIYGTRDRTPLLVGTTYRHINYKTRFGIADERGYYYRMTELLSKTRNWSLYKITYLKKKSPTRVEIVCGGLGYYALMHRGDVHVIDRCALSDPLLSQIPAVQLDNWRIGHEVRKLPTNYVLKVIDNNVQLTDEQVDFLLRDIHLVTHAPLLSWERIKAIYQLNTFHYRFDKNKYANPKIQVLLVSDKIKKAYKKTLEEDFADHISYNIQS